MAILIEATTVVAKVSSLNARFPGGVTAFERQAPNGTYRSDGLIAGLSFMVPSDAWLFARTLLAHGFADPSTDTSDLAVVDQAEGILYPCDWLQVDLKVFRSPDGQAWPAAVAWVGDTAPVTFEAAAGWRPRTLQRISVADLQRDYEPVKSEGDAGTGAAVATYRHRHTGALLYIGRPALSEQLSEQTIDERLAALHKSLAMVESTANSRERSEQIDKLRDCARVLVEDTHGAVRGPLMAEGIAARLARRWKDAERVFRTVTDRWPAEVDGWLELTWALASLDRPEEALVTARIAAELRPDSPASLGNLAGVLVQNGLAKEALPVIRRALQLDPSDRTNQQVFRRVEQSVAMPDPVLEPARTTPWYKRWFG